MCALKLALCLYVCTVSVNAFGISSPSLKNHFSGINVDFHLGDTQTLAQLYWLVSYLESLRQLSGLYFRKFSLAIYNVYFGQWYNELINSGKWKGTVLRLDRKKKKNKTGKKVFSKTRRTTTGIRNDVNTTGWSDSIPFTVELLIQNHCSTKTFATSNKLGNKGA